MPLLALVERADFDRLLKTRPLARSEHFFLHHLRPDAAATPDRRGRSLDGADAMDASGDKLSTIGGQARTRAVDNSARLGLMVPKRMAKRAVTRNTVKRQAREVLRPLLTVRPGHWLLRLRAPIDRQAFPSATSDALRRMLRQELLSMVPALCAKVPVDEPAATAATPTPTQSPRSPAADGECAMIAPS